MFVALAVSFAVASNFFSVSATVVGLFFLAVGAWKFASTAREQDRWYEEVGLQRGTKLFVFAAASSSELTIFPVYLASSVFRLAAALITLVSFCAGTIASPATVTLVGVRRMGRSLRAPGKEKQIDYAIPPVLLAPWAPVLAGG